MITLKEAEILKDVHSDIRGELFIEALRMEKEGQKVLKLNTGNPGSFGFVMPDSIKNALVSNIDKSVAYCDYRGMLQAREAICRFHNEGGIKKLTPDDIFITNGVSEGVSMLTTAFINPGDEVLLPTPCYPLWSNCVKIAGGVPVYYKCDEEKDWNPSVEDIESKITSKTKAVLIINPNNPTGALYSEDIVKEIVEVAEKNNLVIFSDEIYDRLLYDGKVFTSTGKFAKEDTVVVTTNGLSKSHSVCGFRCGWMAISGNEKAKAGLINGIMKIATMRLCSNAIMQLAIPEALSDMEYPNSLTKPGGRLYQQRKAVKEALAKAKHISAVTNMGAFYMFAKVDFKGKEVTDDRKFCMDLLHSKKILVMPGSCFNYETPDHFRIVMLPEEDIIGEAIEKIDDFFDEYINK